MITTIRYVFLVAIRDKLFLGIYIALLFSLIVAKFLGDLALVEQKETSVIFIANAVRLVLFLGVVIFICFQIRRSFENKEIVLILSRPIGYFGFVFSYWVAIVLTILILILPVSLFIYFFLKTNLFAVFMWSISIYGELLIVAAFAIFASMVLKSAMSSVLLSFGFYFVARMMGFFLYFLDSSYAKISSLENVVMVNLLKLISAITPRLDLFSQSSWLIYGYEFSQKEAIFIPQSIIFVPLLLLMSVFDLKRKQF